MNIPANTPGKVLLSASGSADTHTASFTVTGSWALAYSYDCTGQTEQANLLIFPTDVTGQQVLVPVNKMNGRGSGLERHSEHGKFYLIVTSKCAWNVKVQG